MMLGGGIKSPPVLRRRFPKLNQARIHRAPQATGIDLDQPTGASVSTPASSAPPADGHPGRYRKGVSLCGGEVIGRSLHLSLWKCVYCPVAPRGGRVQGLPIAQARSMKPTLLVREVLPFFLSLAALFAATLLVDVVLHLLQAVWLGRYLGIPGVLMILGSFGHSLRKRRIIQIGDPVLLLRVHENVAWAGALLVLVHAGIHFNAVLAWLAVAAMVVNVTSGLVGKFLLRRAQGWLKHARADLREHGVSDAEIADELHWDSLTVDMVRQWRKLHLPIALAFGMLALAHIIAVFVFWGWK
jgi:hypothetical protein